jgi:hypothetical protein
MSGPWKEVADPNSGKVYYYNKATKETKWKLNDDELANCIRLADGTVPKSPPKPPIANDDSGSDDDGNIDTDDEAAGGGAGAVENEDENENEIQAKSGFEEDEVRRHGNAHAKPVGHRRNKSSMDMRKNSLAGVRIAGDNANGGIAVDQAKQKARVRKILDDGEDEKEAAAPLPSDEMMKNIFDATVEAEEIDLGDPNDWKKEIDRRNGRVYYWNVNTRQTSYHKPAGFMSPEDIAAEGKKPRRLSRGASNDEETEAEVAISKAPMSKNERQLMMIRDRKQKHSRNKSQGGLGGDEAPRKVVSDDDDAGGAISPPEASPPVVDEKDAKDHSDDEPEISIHAEGIEFELTHHRKGLLKRVFHLGKSHDRETMLSFKKSLIKKSLLKENRSKDALAIQCFKNIMSYMGDRKSVKADVQHARKLIKNALKTDRPMQDEIFLQICKQVTKHPKLSHCIKGWELMNIVLGCLPPSNVMRSYIESLVNHSLQESDVDEALKAQLKTVLERIPKITQAGPRREAPSAEEIKRFQTGVVNSLKIYILDGTFRSMEVDSFAQCKDVAQMMVHSLGIGYPQIFGLFELNRHGEERYLDPAQRVLDVLGNWDRIIKEHGIKHPEPFRMMFKADLVLKSSFPKLHEDDDSLKMMYIQCIHDIGVQRYPIDIKIAPSIYALHLIHTYGTFAPETHTLSWLEEKCDELLPEAVLRYYHKKHSEAVKIAAQKILSKYAKLDNVNAVEARLSLLDYVEDLPLYGAYMIKVEQDHDKDLPPVIQLAATYDGVKLVHPKTKDIIETFNWPEIVTWGASHSKFALQVGDLISQRKLLFKTQHAADFVRVLEGYVRETAELQRK